jgi:hypothetical protein
LGWTHETIKVDGLNVIQLMSFTRVGLDVIVIEWAISLEIQYSESSIKFVTVTEEVC